MKAEELIQLLEDVEPDTEVRIMSQPSWPFEYSIRGTNLASELGDFKPHGYKEDQDDNVDVLYLLEGRQLGYGTKDAWNI
jgi:hypothetical protein